jgi:hypothetical protein
METAGIGGDSGQPRRDPFIQVKNTPVIIDLVTLYSYEPFHEGVYNPDGLQFRKLTPGTLLEWGLSEWGEMFGKVTYTIPAKGRDETVTHWVPSWVLKRAPKD